MEDLPDEIISNILEFVDPVTKLRASLVNRRFYEIATDPLLHRYAAFKTTDYLPEMTILTYLKKFGEGLRYLDLQDCYWLRLSMFSIIQQCCTNLTYLNLLGCVEIPVNTILSIFRKNPKLQHFGWTVGLNLLMSLKNIHTGQGRHALEQVNGIAVLFEQLVSLKIGLLVYCATAYRDGFEPETAVFTHLISRIISPRLTKLTVICIERGQLMLNPKFSRVLLELHVELVELNPKSTVLHEYMDMKNNFEKTRNELRIAALSGHDGIIRGWLKYVLSKQSHSLKALESPGPPFLNFWIPLLGNGLKSCEVTGMKRLNISSSHDVPIYWMNSVLMANSLTSLNLSNMECVTGNLLQVISEGSPYLESLNLQGCHDCLEPIEGLKSIAGKCHWLRHLNLSCIHYHASTPTNILLQILSHIRYLISVSLSSCCVMPFSLATDDNQELPERSTTINVDKTESQAVLCDTSDGLSTISSNSCLGNDEECRQTNTDEQIGGSFSLQSFVHCCSFLQEIEIISVGFHSVLRKGWPISRPPPERVNLIWDCPDHESKFLEALSSCHCLQRLTLAGLDIRGGLEFLLKITSSCQQLHFLSLAQLRGLEMANTLPILNRALACCHNLKQLRFEQSYFAVPQSFTMSLAEVSTLESLCIITKEGSIPVSTILPLFDKCQRLRVLQICADTSSSEETFRNITRILYNKYSSERPGLAVCIFPYDSNTRDLHDKLFNHANEHSFPLVHLKQLSLFGAEVATRTY